ncbi:MAG: metallophosphoesterase family protein [Pseudomonadota bacterium]
MTRILVSADVHGSVGAWMTLMELLEPGDTLAIAGDLFDTRYGNPKDQDFQPYLIKSDLAAMAHRFYYVYGNCDDADYFPSRAHVMRFQHMGLEIVLHHGHRPLGPIPGSTGIIVQGHTHLSCLELRDSHIHLNPGSLARPRDGLHTYAVIDDARVSLMNLRTGKPLACLELDRITALHQPL